MHHSRLAGGLAALAALLILLAAAPLAQAARLPAANPEVARQARKLVGVPYAPGGVTAAGLDAPGLAKLASRRAGLWLPNGTRRQAAHGIAIRRARLRAGDLVFSRNFARVGVYLGAGRVVTVARGFVRRAPLRSLGARPRLRRYDGATGYHAAFLARQCLGVPYVFGGADPSGFDAAGLVMYVYAQLGVELDHGATAQQQATRLVGLGDLRRGDLVFFGDEQYSSHVGVYLGGGIMIDAPHAGAVVSRTPITGAWIGGRLLPVR